MRSFSLTHATMSQKSALSYGVRKGFQGFVWNFGRAQKREPNRQALNKGSENASKVCEKFHKLHLRAF